MVEQSGNTTSATVQQFTNGTGSFVNQSGWLNTTSVAQYPLEDPGAFTLAPGSPFRGRPRHEAFMTFHRARPADHRGRGRIGLGALGRDRSGRQSPRTSAERQVG